MNARVAVVIVLERILGDEDTVESMVFADAAQAREWVECAARDEASAYGLVSSQVFDGETLRLNGDEHTIRYLIQEREVRPPHLR